MASDLASRLRRGWLIAGIALLCACDGSRTTGADAERSGPTLPQAAVHDAVGAFNEAHSDAVTAAATETTLLAAAARAFTGDPTPVTRGTFQQAWFDAHNRFAEVLILRPAADAEARFMIDAWPITPGYLDSLPEHPHSGIVSEPTLDIDAEMLEEQHGFTDVSEVALGFHPLEYYAFERPLEDFVSGENADRRRDLVTELASDLQRRIDALAAEPLPGEPADVEAAAAASELFAVLSGGIAQAAIDTGGRAGDLSHSPFAGADLAFANAQVRQVRQILQPDGAIMRLVAAVDPAAAAELEATLALAPDAGGQRVLWLSAIEQQLGLMADRLR